VGNVGASHPILGWGHYSCALMPSLRRFRSWNLPAPVFLQPGPFPSMWCAGHQAQMCGEEYM
jgi:hypothetical protein